MGVIPEGTQLTDRTSAEIPAWESLSADEQASVRQSKWKYSPPCSRTLMHRSAKCLMCLQRTGQLDNTLIMVTADNGSSGEGGLTGSFNETYVLNGLQTPFEANMAAP